MIRSGWKLLLVGAVVAVTLSFAVPAADAQWGCCGYRPVAWGCYAPRYVSCYTPCYSACYTPCYSACYSPCYDSCGLYLGCRPGPVRRLLLGSYRWYGAGCWSGCSSSCCSTYTSGCCDAVPSAIPTAPNANPSQQPTPAKKPVADPAIPGAPVPADPGTLGTPPETDPSKALPPPSTTPTSANAAENSGILTVWVPFDAKVTINGLETHKTGSRREFVSFGLKEGFNYKYVVKAQVERDGKMLEDTQTVVLTAGQIKAVAFGFNVNPGEQVAAAQ
jgi:uncharacterized protein (TIGR03000 family)